MGCSFLAPVMQLKAPPALAGAACYARPEPRCACYSGLFAAVACPPDNPKAYGRRRTAQPAVASVRWVSRAVLHPRRLQAPWSWRDSTVAVNEGTVSEEAMIV